MNDFKVQLENEMDYLVVVEYKEGFGYGGFLDCDKIKEMYEFQCNLIFYYVIWLFMNNEVKYFYWFYVFNIGGD